MRSIIYVPLAATLVLLGGCADDAQDGASSGLTPTPVTTVSQADEEPPQPEPETATGEGEAAEEGETDADEAIEAYVNGVASARPSVARDALDYAAPGSVAHTYLQHQANLFEAALDGGIEYGSSTVDATSDGYQMCDPFDATECNEFTYFEVVDDKVADFLVDGVSPGPRLAVGDGSVVDSASVSAEFLTAYLSISGETLFVTVKVETGEERTELNIYSATYRGPDGRQREAADAMGPFEIGAESTATIALVFPEAEPGGTVTLDGHVGGDYTATVELQVQTG